MAKQLKRIEQLLSLFNIHVAANDLTEDEKKSYNFLIRERDKLINQNI